MSRGDEGVRVEALQAREPPGLLGRVRQRQLVVPSERDVTAHVAYLRWSMSAFPSLSWKNAILQTPVSCSPSKATPRASSSAFAAGTSGTRSAIAEECGTNSCPTAAGFVR